MLFTFCSGFRVRGCCLRFFVLADRLFELFQDGLEVIGRALFSLLGSRSDSLRSDCWGRWPLGCDSVGEFVEMIFLENILFVVRLILVFVGFIVAIGVV